MPISRREFLSYAAGLAGSALPISRLRAQPRFDKYPYTLGVASGYPDEGGFVLWTRLAPEPLEVAAAPASPPATKAAPRPVAKAPPPKKAPSSTVAAPRKGP